MKQYLKSPLIALAIAHAFYGGVAAADSAATTQHRSVAFRDLNLQSREGATTLYKRIERAADSMCALSWSIRELGGSSTLASQVRDCQMQAIERVVTQVNAPMLTAVFNDKVHGKSKPMRIVRAP